MCIGTYEKRIYELWMMPTWLINYILNLWIGKPIESKFSHYYKSSYQNDYLTNIPKDGSFAHQLNEFVNQTEQILGGLHDWFS